MNLKDSLLAQLDREAEGTRKALANVPENKNDWKPHPKSMPLGRLPDAVDPRLRGQDQVLDDLRGGPFLRARPESRLGRRHVLDRRDHPLPGDDHVHDEPRHGRHRPTSVEETVRAAARPAHTR